MSSFCHLFVIRLVLFLQDELLQQLASATMQLRQLAQQILHLRCGEVMLIRHGDAVDVLCNIFSNYGINCVNASLMYIRYIYIYIYIDR